MQALGPPSPRPRFSTWGIVKIWSLAAPMSPRFSALNYCSSEKFSGSSLVLIRLMGHHPSPSGARTKDALRSLGEAGHFTPATHPEWLRMAGQFLSGAERNLPRRSLGVGGPFTPDGGLGLPPLPGLRRTRRMGAGFPTETDSVAASPRPTGAISGGAANRRPGWRPRPAGLCRPPGSPTPASSASRRRQERWRGRPRSAPAPCCR